SAASAETILFSTACSCLLRMLLLSRRCRKLTRLPAIRNPCARNERRIAERSFFTFKASVGTSLFYQAQPCEATTQNSVALSGLGIFLTINPGRCPGLLSFGLTALLI